MNNGKKPQEKRGLADFFSWKKRKCTDTDSSNRVSQQDVPRATVNPTATAGANTKNLPLLVVAFDLGTTFSGYAFAFISERDKIIANQAWPSSKMLSMKTPTSVLLNPDGKFHSFGHEAEKMFGQLCSEDKQKDWRLFRRFKMALHKKGHVSRDCLIDDVAEKPMKALPIFTMAIQYLRDHLLEALGRQYLGIEEKGILYMLTVPAIWDDSAKQFMREAAIKAGINCNRLKLSLEPEAAAIWCGGLDKAIPGSSVTLRKLYMIVDIGGGTVDIAVQERQSDGSIKNLEKPSGGPWGGTYVDKNFLNTLITLFGQQAFDSWKTGNMEDFFELLMNFEFKKRSLDVATGFTETIQIPFTLFQTSEDVNGKLFDELITASCYTGRISKGGPDKLRFKGDIVREWFDGPINEVINHIKDVLATHNNVRTILLAGGFSESKYVQDRIKQQFPDRQVVVPQDAGLAVLKGAVLFGTQPGIITSRVMGCTYGMALDMGDRQNMFVVFVRIGDEVPLGKKIKQHDLILTDFDFTDIQIYRSPEYDPKLITEAGCEWFGTLNIPHERRFEQRYRERLVDVTFIFGDTELEVSVLIKSTGQTHRLGLNCLA